MSETPAQILSRLSRDEFVGRDAEVRIVCDLALRASSSNALLLGAPRIGKTEILLRSFDYLFQERGTVIPFYFALKRSSLDPERFAREYFSQMLAQFLAFRSNDSRLISGNEPLALIARAAPLEDRPWVTSLIDSFIPALESGDESQMLRFALSTPAAAGSYAKLKPLVMIDNWHLVSGADLHNEFMRALTVRGSDEIATHLLCGLQRVLVDLIPPDADLFDKLEIIRVAQLSEDEYEAVVSRLSEARGIQLSESAIELMSQQLNRDLFYTRSIVDAAAARGSRLQTFIEFERLYTGEVVGGRIGHYFDAVLREMASGTRKGRGTLEALVFLIEAGSPIPIDAVIERVAKHTGDAEAVIESMHSRELLDANFGFVSAPTDPVLSDYVRAKHRSEIAGAARPVAGDELLGEKLKHSYRLMMSRYNRAIQSQLIEVLSRFDFQSIPSSLFDQAAFEKRYRGMSRVQVRRALDDEHERVRLPQIVVVNDLGASEEGGVGCRLFAATGFDGGIYTDANEVLWLVALLNSKEPLDVEAIGWIDRRIDLALSEHTGRHNAAPTVVRWYISKEGFSAVASERFTNSQADSQSNIESNLSCWRSTYSHLDLLQDYLDKLALGTEARPATVFELVIPIEDEAELIAARTAEQIARAADFDQEAINQIKTALIEACINAAEHSDSPDRKIHQRFAIDENRLIITVSNKGKTFGRANVQSTPSVVAQPAKGARGRGLQIIRALMDEVEFERTDDGARLVMTKYLKRPDNQ
ncbi:MAG TPA: ATP-binding protein [Blastocatellia bacterium]|nr:ATP-binding protein [Blastocatellia bacterium]